MRFNGSKIRLNTDERAHSNYEYTEKHKVKWYL